MLFSNVNKMGLVVSCLKSSIRPITLCRLNHIWQRAIITWPTSKRRHKSHIYSVLSLSTYFLEFWANLPNRTVRCAEGLWRMRRHGPVIAHCIPIRKTFRILFCQSGPARCSFGVTLNQVFMNDIHIDHRRCPYRQQTTSTSRIGHKHRRMCRVHSFVMPQFKFTSERVVVDSRRDLSKAKLSFWRRRR